MKNFLLHTFRFVVLFVVFGEIVFRTPILPASNIPHTKQESEFALPVNESVPNREGLFTDGPASSPRNVWHVNNDGFLYQRDFVRWQNRKEPCIAVIGDSYVEAIQLPYSRQLSTTLQTRVGDSYVVYPMGVSGAGLSEYLQMSRFAEIKYKPSIYIIVITKDDIFEALNKTRNDMLTFKMVGNKIVASPPIFVRSNPYKKMMRYSAFIRYFYINQGVRFEQFYQPILESLCGRNKISSTENVGQTEQYLEITKYIFTKFITEHPGKKIMFVVDADRKYIYDTYQRPPPLAEYDYLSKACAGTGCITVDLSKVFWQDYLKNNICFNFPRDLHWNEHGNSVVAEAIYEKLCVLGWLPQAK